ncbi:MAG: DUF2804 domain-containing protein [Clostridia bacterium]|nr:DUF2804 domain-containing protein [Clostridia bacterium]
MDFKKYLADERIPVPTPDDVVDENGKCYFGTFDKEFPAMNFMNVHRQSRVLPDFMNKFRYTSWEAVELTLKDVVVLTAVCNMGFFGTSLTIVYDKKTKKKIACQEMMLPAQAVMAPTIINGDICYSNSIINRVKIKNNFEKGKAYVSGRVINPGKFFKYNFELTRVSKPSVVMIPFGKNKPLYSQKDLFHADGYIIVNGKKYKTDKDSTAIIDDHRGYYPYKMHYDWVTTMGTNTVNGKKEFFGFNLTRNQSIDQDKYNENLIWFQGETSRITPVYFHYDKPDLCHVYDDYGMVDLYYEIGDKHPMIMHLGIIDEDYTITFGELRGFIKDEDGNEYCLDGMVGIGEDKSLRI